MEVKGFEMVEHPHRSAVSKQSSRLESELLVAPQTVVLGGMVINKESIGIPNNCFYDQSLADFTKIIKGIDDKINQAFKNSNSNIHSYVTINDTIGSIKVQNVNGISTKDPGQIVIVMEINLEDKVRAKEKELIPTEFTNISFELSWVEKNHPWKGGLPRGRGKGKNKISGSGSDLAHSRLGLDQNIRHGPERKGEFYMDSMELGEKEKRAKRDDDVLVLPTFMG